MREKEIRPEKLFKKFIHLASNDVKKFFSEKRIKINCIACKNKAKFSFKKSSFSYCLCTKCHTLFVNPRPKESAFLNYYTKSSSIKSLAQLYEKTKQARKKTIWQPKAKIILETIKENRAEDYTIVDIGGGHGFFAEEILKIKKKKIIIIEPSPIMAKECKRKKLNVIQKFLENVKKSDLPQSKKCFTSFELFEHLHDPSKFVKNLRKLMKKGDLFIFTTLSGTGADILTLWNNSRSVNPPHHINFFNPKSISIFLKKNKLKILDISTPGKIDIDILNNDKSFIKDRFWKTFLSLATIEDRQKMQNLISDINLSSHMMIVCKK